MTDRGIEREIIDVSSAIAIWSVAIPPWRDAPKGGVWLAFMLKNDSGNYRLEFSYRWYVDDIVSGAESRDRMSFYAVTFKVQPLNDTEAIERGRGYRNVVQDRCGSANTWEIVRGARTVEEFCELVRSMPGIHLREGRLP